jgi:hypothetical protein
MLAVPIPSAASSWDGTLTFGTMSTDRLDLRAKPQVSASS